MEHFHDSLERHRTCDQAARECVSVNLDRIAVLVNTWPHFKCPEQSNDGNEQPAFSDVKPRAHPSARTKIEMRALCRVGADAKELARGFVGVVTRRVELARVLESLWVVVDGPDLSIDSQWTNRVI